MSSNKSGKPKKKKSGLLIALIIIFVILLIAVGGLGWYSANLKPDKDKFNSEKVIEIPEGAYLSTVGKLFADEGIIKNSTAFKVYTKLNKVKPLQAGRYGVTPDMELKDIIKMIENGETYTGDQLQFTFIEGKKITWLADQIAQYTSNTAEDVYALLKDESYIDSVIEKYWFITDEIKNEDIYYPLEGYLFRIHILWKTLM